MLRSLASRLTGAETTAMMAGGARGTAPGVGRATVSVGTACVGWLAIGSVMTGVATRGGAA